MSWAIQADFAYALFLEASFSFLSANLLQGQRCSVEVVCQGQAVYRAWMGDKLLARLPILFLVFDICLVYLFVRLYVLSLSGYEPFLPPVAIFSMRFVSFFFAILSSVPAIRRASDIYGLVTGTFGIHAHA